MEIVGIRSISGLTILSVPSREVAEVVLYVLLTAEWDPPSPILAQARDVFENIVRITVSAFDFSLRWPPRKALHGAENSFVFFSQCRSHDRALGRPRRLSIVHQLLYAHYFRQPPCA